jgi:hypothetical protein
MTQTHILMLPLAMMVLASIETVAATSAHHHHHHHHHYYCSQQVADYVAGIANRIQAFQEQP